MFEAAPLDDMDVPHATFPALAQRPETWELAALGIVLCLYRATDGDPLDGWHRAASCVHRHQVDSDGVHESAQFHDAGHECCWQLHLLPEGNFVAWDRLGRRLPACSALPERRADFVAQLRQRLGRQLRGERWRGRALQLYAVRDTEGASAPLALAARPAAISACGRAKARQVLARHGAEPDACLAAALAENARAARAPA